MVFCINVLLWILSAYNIFLIAGVFLSWMPFLYKYKFFRIVGKIGDWYMKPFTGILVIGPLDFTPIIGFMLYDGLIGLVYYLL